MQIETARPPVIDEILSQLGETYGITKQREGVHATDTIYCLRKAFWNKTDPLPPTLTESLYYLTGLGLQDALFSASSPHAIQVDGIWMSPDYLKDGVLLELKTTMMGQKRLDAYDFPEGWIKQIKAYCYGYKLNQAVLMVIMLLKREYPLSYVLTFTGEELKENWMWIKARGLLLQTCLNNNVVPGEKGFDFECNSCRYRLRCMMHEGGKDATSIEPSQ